MKLPSINYVLDAWLRGLKRFPLAALTAFIGTFCAILMIDDFDQDIFIFKLILSCLVFFPFFIIIKVMEEVYKWKPSIGIGLNLLFLVLMAAYAFFMAPHPDAYAHTHVIQFFIFLAVSHLCATFFPYFKNNNSFDFWEYNRSLFINFITGAVYMSVIILGLFIALMALITLFNLDVDGKVYGYIVALTAGVFHTGYFLSVFPSRYKFKISTTSYHLGYINLVKYILISLVVLYLIILYAFGLKIMVNWELPKGFVALLVLGFSIAGILSYLLNYMLPEIEGSGWVKLYKKWFFYALLPVTALLFVGLFKRIGDYGYTEERYFILITGIFLVFVCLYFIMSKKDDIRVIPIAMTMACLITGLGGPIGAFSVSKKSQLKRLATLLEQSKITKNGILQSKEDQTYITNGNRNSKDSVGNQIGFFLDRQYYDVLEKWTGPLEFEPASSSYDKKVHVLEKFNIYMPKAARVEKKRSNIRIISADKFEAINIQSFDNFINLNTGNGNQKGYHLKTVSFTSQVVFKNEDVILDTLDLKDFIMSLEPQDFGYYEDHLPSKDLQIDIESETRIYKLALNKFSFRYEEGLIYLNYLQGHLFWKDN